MAATWDILKETYNYIVDDLSHPLTKNWFLVSSPVPLLVILVSYNIFCAKIGPWLMKHRKPYELKTAIKLYNIIQVIISLYITYEGYRYIFSGNFDFKCQGVGKSEIRVARGIQMYFLTKLIELLDTVFFVLRKSDRQVTFLHLYHHTIMPFASWIALKYLPGGQGVMIGTLNSFIHVIMYSYYLLSSLGPQYQKYMWWKKYLTVLQIVQFIIVLIHSMNSLRYSCDYPAIFKLLISLEAIIFIYMFSKFYWRSYIVNGKKSTTVSNGQYINDNSDSKVNGIPKEAIKNDFAKSMAYRKSNGHNGYSVCNRRIKNL